MEESKKQAQPLLIMADVVKEFPGVRALNGISFDLYPGEIHCLVGENGAGKSTLMKILSGAYQPTSGTITVEGNKFKNLTPTISKDLGVSIVYQENDLVPSMNAIENIYVGSELTKLGLFSDFKTMREKTIEQVNELGLKLNIDQKIEDMSVSDQQFVKILKVTHTKPKILIMDEPTSMFNIEDSKKVLQLTKKIAANGIGIIYISHFLEEVVEIADRITVIRDGQEISTYDNSKKDTSYDIITKDMVGRPVEMFYAKTKSEIGNISLDVKNLQLQKDSPIINFSLREGEILGFAGMVGSGRTEIMRALVGADSRYKGEIYCNGKKVTIKSPGDSIKEGFAFITEDRQGLGLMLNHSILENGIVLAYKEKIKNFFMSLKKQAPLIKPFKDSLKIKASSLWTEVINLSGGNQQKVVLAKWLLVDKQFYIFDEPTRGIDVNAKAEFYKHINNLALEGKSIIIISSDMPELISLSDRVLVVREGRIDGELVGEQINEHEIINRALGV